MGELKKKMTGLYFFIDVFILLYLFTKKGEKNI